MGDLSSRTQLANTRDSDDEVIDIEAIKKYLQTPYGQVYELSQDGLTYTKPASLRGTPVQRIQEGSASEYWNPQWLSLNDYLAQESREEELKRECKYRSSLDPSNKKLKDDAKRHQDNVSKQRKIREVFGGQQPYHPNQVVSKRYLPDLGLCDQETMYHLGCKISDFHFLANKGLMNMDPWDFVRWRIGHVLMERIKAGLPGAGRSEVKSVIHKIGGQGSEDPLFRQAVLYSARLQGRLNSYGSKKKQRPYLVNGKSQLGKNSLGRSRGTGSRLSRQSVELVSRAPVPEREREEKLRRERRVRLAQQSSGGYQGVNSYRQKMNAAPGGAPCGG